MAAQPTHFPTLHVVARLLNGAMHHQYGFLRDNVAVVFLSTTTNKAPHEQDNGNTFRQVFHFHLMYQCSCKGTANGRKNKVIHTLYCHNPYRFSA